MAAPGVRGQDGRKKGKNSLFSNRDSEGALGSESATMRGSFWTRIRWGNVVAAAGVRGQDARETWKKTSFFLGIQRQRLGAKVQPGEACFGPELDGEKLWRHQVFGARMREKNGRQENFIFSQGFRGSVWERKCPGEARFGPELAGEKLWRRHMFGARMRDKNGRKRLFF